MTQHVATLPRKPFAASQDAAEEFGRELYGARIDPSDDEACFEFLFEQFPTRWRDVIANLKAAIYEAGQLYIDAEIRRAS